MMDATDAFASLISSRMAELEISPRDVAETLEVGATTVSAWVEGSELPADADIELLARSLSLPRSLLREAHRRADEVRWTGSSPQHSTSPGGPEADTAPSAPTHQQDVPAAVMPAAVVEAPLAPVVDDPVAVRFGSPWHLLRDRVERRRIRARAPTRELSYVEEPRQRTTYQLRTTFTVGGVIAMVIILRWAFRGFGSALADLWDTLTGAL